MKKCLLLLFIALTFNVLAQNQRLYVRADAAGANDGSSWQDAFTDLQDALAAAQPGDSVWVTEGTYYPTATNDRTVSFRVKSGVGLFGGFAGGEHSLDERDWEAHPSVLSGAIGSIFSVDNSLHIVFAENPDSNTVLDGFAFTKGVEDADTTYPGGAAIYVWAKDSLIPPVSALRIRNCRFEDNATSWYGGAVSINSNGADHTRFEHCFFSQNNARFGGAVGLNAAEIQAEFIDCQFVSNIALDGGGAVTMTATASGVRFGSCHFEKNRTKDSGGGAVYHSGKSLPGRGVAFDNCLFLENVCEINSYPEGGAIFMASWGGQDTLRIENCTFRKNTGVKAGGVYIDMSGATGSNFMFRHCLFEENEASTGSAIRVGCSGGCSDNIVHSFSLSHCHMVKNKGQTVSIEGSASLLQETLVEVDSCRFADNYNGAVFTLNIGVNARLDITGTLFSANKNGEVIVALASQIFLTHCVVEENTQGYWLFTWEEGTMHLRNCLFRKNQTLDFLFGANFGALHVVNCHFDANAPADDYPFPFFEAEATVRNSAFTNNTGALYAIPGYMHPHFQQCYFDALPNNLPPTVSLGYGILTGGDPLFAAAAAGDFHLHACSPLVGAGDNAAAAVLPTDLDGQPRIRGGAVDIGIFENAGPQLAAAPEIVSPCPGDPTGSIVLHAENGCAPYAIAWSSGVAGGQQLNGLAAGDYLFSITDARGSVLVVPVTIPEKPAPALTPVISPVDCDNTSGGSAALTAAGAAPFAFLWPDGATDSVRTGLTAGAYPVTIVDAAGCAGMDTITITTRGRLHAEVTIDPISCPGFADGKLTVTPQSGLAPYRWLWETGDTTAALAGLGAGLYRLTLTDALGCKIAWMIPLIEPDVDCYGEADGVFPNPFSDYLTLRAEFAHGNAPRWVLTDALERVVTTVLPESSSTTLHLSGLPAGLYFWQLWRDGRLIRAGSVAKQ